MRDFEGRNAFSFFDCRKAGADVFRKGENHVENPS
jgi:hypothetical protein